MRSQPKEKRGKIERLYLRPGSAGERVAAANALKRIQTKELGVLCYQKILFGEIGPVLTKKV